jgi:hypothetical protein
MSRFIFPAIVAAAAVHLGSISEANAAVNLAGGWSYTNDFFDLSDFTETTKWSNSNVFPSGVTAITKEGSNFQDGNSVGNSTSGKNSGNSATPFTPSFPLNPIVPATSYHAVNSGFSGKWLINAANGSVYDNATDSWSTYGSTTLTLENIGAHTNLTLSVLIAAGDSFDTSRTTSGANNGSYDGPLQILIDGQIVFERRFSGGGTVVTSGTNTRGFINGATGSLTTLGTGLNASGSYLENWADNNGDGPLNENNRSAATWTLDSAYLLTLNLAHVGSDAVIEFRHYVSSGANDEFIALDSLSIMATPEPSRALLLLGGLIGFLLRRHRR